MSDTMKALDALDELEGLAREAFGGRSSIEASKLADTLRAALTPPADDEIEAVRALYAKVRAARTACTPDAPESIWQAKDEAERDWEDATNYTNPNGVVATLLRALDAERQRRVEVEGALATMTDCQPLPKVYKYTGTAEVDVENMFDVGHRHRNGKQPRDYLMSWLSMFRPFAYATKDDSWGELEKLISITMNNYVQILVKAESARAALNQEPGQ